jgi:glycosyltransferase involved in cell wall biosynthesis
VALAALWLKIPFVVTAHGSDINVYAERRFIRDQLVWAFGRAKAVIAVSHALQQKICALAPPVCRRVTHIPCAGIDPNVFMVRDRDAARAILGFPGSGRIILFVGQLVPVKAVNVLVSAWRKMLIEGKTHPDDRLVIVGDGPERSALAAQIPSSQRATVLFTGDISQEGVARWLSAATVLCLPSRNEGTPNVVIEALASGRPVVASRVGGVPEVVSDGRNGFLVEYGDDDMLADALCRALERHWDGAAISAGISDWTWTMLASRNVAVFHEVLSGREESTACAG